MPTCARAGFRPWPAVAAGLLLACALACADPASLASTLGASSGADSTAGRASRFALRISAGTNWLGAPSAFRGNTDRGLATTIALDLAFSRSWSFSLQSERVSQSRQERFTGGFVDSSFFVPPPTIRVHYSAATLAFGLRYQGGEGFSPTAWAGVGYGQTAFADSGKSWGFAYSASVGLQSPRFQRVRAFVDMGVIGVHGEAMTLAFPLRVGLHAL